MQELQPSFLNLYGFPGAVCTSINEVVVHGIPSNRKLKEGDLFQWMLAHVINAIMVIVPGHMLLVRLVVKLLT